MKNEQIEKLNAARLEIFHCEPILGYILQNLKISFRDDLKTAATDGQDIFFNREFLDSLSQEETVFILLHELLHLVLLHPARKTNKDQRIHNIACDIVVNEIILASGYSYGSLNPLLRNQFKGLFGFNDTSDSLYFKLKRRRNPPKTIVSNHDFWDEKKAGQIQGIIEKAFKLGYSFRSKRIANELEKNQPGKIDWKRILDRFIQRNIYDYSYSRTRQGLDRIVLPKFTNIEDSLEDIWIVVDVSNSMRNKQTKKIVVEIANIVKQITHVNCSISFFSNIVTTPVEFTNEDDLEQALKNIETTGGTDFSIIFKNLKQFFKTKPKAIVIFTDGYSRFPNKNLTMNIPIIWVLEKNRVFPPYGKVVRI